MKNEIWKDIEGFEGLYQVSNLGRVKSLGNGCPSRWNGKERILKSGKRNNGYLYVIICKYGKKNIFQVHRLVAKAFIPNPFNLPQVNHKDENKENNCVENLEWCDAKYNSNYGTSIKRSVEKRSKKVLCVETNIIYTSIKEAEKQTGIAKQNISACCLNKPKYKTTGGYHWRFVD